ncbi:MAG: hemerythrin domain-containing protein, partial [Planctomycetota bacterium]|nr:hemerythrin domain-containing protein [Planctomycetota bacterium]
RRLLDALRLMGPGASGEAPRDWTRVPLDEVMDHIVNTHHAFLRRELPRLAQIVETVARVHGEAHGELAEVQLIFAALVDAIEPHLEQEETHVFPAIRARATTDPAKLEASLAELEADHDEVGQALHRLRALTKGFEQPEDACALYVQMLDGLVALERDMHAHVHLENEVLIRRARE